MKYTEKKEYTFPEPAHKGMDILYSLDENGCWNCTSHSKDKDGYCRISRKGIQTRIHRYIFILLNGKLGNDMVVRHVCDNPGCINPAHLLAGTNDDNVRDRVERGRSSQGENHGRAKFSKRDIIEIRQNPQSNITELAKVYEVATHTIRDIIQRRTWRQVV